MSVGKIASKLIDRGILFISADVTDAYDIRSLIRAIDPDVIIHTAAITDVDECAKDPTHALNVNAVGVNNIVDWWTGKFIYLSTDHVFSGTKWISSGYTERHEPSPVNEYGLTKLAGESIALSGVAKAKVIRTSKIFSSFTIDDFMNDLVYEDDFEITGLLKRSFLYDEHFVDGLLDAVEKFDNLPEILNIAGTSILSYAEFYKLVCRVFSIDEDSFTVRKTKLKEATPRPLRAGLNIKQAEKLGIPLYSALDGIKQAKQDMNYEN